MSVWVLAAGGEISNLKRRSAFHGSLRLNSAATQVPAVLAALVTGYLRFVNLTGEYIAP